MAKTEIKLNLAMQRAIERARVNRPKARVISAAQRLFQVDSTNNAKTYEIEFSVEGNRKFAVCRNKETGENCKGLTERTVCYHVAVAAGINIALRSEMQTAEAIEAIEENRQEKVLEVRAAKSFESDPRFFLRPSSTKKPEKIGNIRI